MIEIHYRSVFGKVKMINDLEFVQIFSARLFHDLAGTLGAINSAIEFVHSEDVEVKNKALELIDLSSNQANDRLRFMRYAYGISKYSGDADLDIVRELCLLLAKDKRVDVEFTPPGRLTNEKSMDVSVGKLIVCLASLTKNALIRGGIVKIAWQNDDTITVTGEGEEIKEPAELHDIINGEEYLDVPITPRNVHAYYIFRLLETKKIKLDIQSDKKSLTYKIK